MSLIVSLSLLFSSFPISITRAASSTAERLAGRIVLQVQNNGEAWYISPVDYKRYYLGRPRDAWNIMRALGLGATDANLARVPINGTSWTIDKDMIKYVKGRILIQVQLHGEAWYVSPVNLHRYYMGRPADAFQLMRNLGLGITNSDLAKIEVGTVNVDNSTNSNSTDNSSDSSSSTSDNSTSSNSNDNTGTNVEDTRTTTVSSVSGLLNAIAATENGGPKTILLADGTYTLDNMIWVAASGVTVRSVSGNRDSVVLRGDGMTGSVSHIFNVDGSNFTVRDVTMRNVANHAVQLQDDIDSLNVINVHVLDTGEQMIKAAYNADNLSQTSDNGLVLNSLFEFSAGQGSQYYTGGIDVHNGKNWIVRGNTFKNIKSPSDTTAEFAIHFWSGSENTLVEKNLIMNCDRGIGFGLGTDRGHVNGIIRNNMIYHDTSEGFADVSIGLESATGSEVYNNTIYMANSYPNAIEYRFSTTQNVSITNNLTNKAISQRDGASGTVAHNVENAQASWFTCLSCGNLHLGSSVSSVVDHGQSISGLTDDYDGQSRPRGAGIDIGADEY